jgi:hypothetical protein
MRLPWFKLLIHNQKRRHRFGLTLVFLIGALRTPPGRMIANENANLEEFVALLLSIRDNTPESHYIHVGLCDRLHQPVANPAPSFCRPSNTARPLPSPTINHRTLVLQPVYFPDPMRGIDSIVEALWPQLVEPIMSGKFSFYDGAFHPFGKNDLAFIAEALALPDEDET